MNARKLISEKKIQESDSGWRSDDLPPKFAPIYSKTRPIRGSWRWRSAKAKSALNEYVLFVLCDPMRANWKATLVATTANGPVVAGRFEDHGSHPGLHGHANCDGELKYGAEGLDNLRRYPDAHKFHRRRHSWTEAGFWEASKRFFSINEVKGSLL